MNSGPNIGDPVLGGRYTLLAEVKGSIGGNAVHLGSKGKCRYCSATGTGRFRTKAHAFPQALGNKWVISRDECDTCNQLFSKYDDAIAKAVGPFLTLGGVKGKSNKVRQTGRSDGGAVLARRDGAQRPGLSMHANNADPAQHVTVTPAGNLRLSMPIADDPFKPRHAYKALVKMAIAMLPDNELDNYKKLCAWLLDPEDAVEFPRLEVGISFASIGNAPPLTSGTLLRRSDPADVVPHILFIFSAGSVCFQVDLMSDHLEDHLPPVRSGMIKIEWTNIVGDPASSRELKFNYGKPLHLNWTSAVSEPQPVKAVVLDFDPGTQAGSLTPIFR
jgi:hypothetical protein